MAPGKREAARLRTMEEIMAAARRQLADVGAAALSLRSVARDVGMVSSAVYRYVASRDELLTLLIIEAYDDLGDAIDASLAAASGAGDADRWLTAALAIRRWALDHPHQYVLLYGSPVPGYAAPETTVEPGIRPAVALGTIVREAAVGERLAPVPAGAPPIPDALAMELAALAGTLDFAAPADHLAAFLTAWTQLFGLVGFELTNQTRGVVTDHEALFVAAARLMAHRIGLR